MTTMPAITHSTMSTPTQWTQDQQQESSPSSSGSINFFGLPSLRVYLPLKGVYFKARENYRFSKENYGDLKGLMVRMRVKTNVIRNIIRKKVLVFFAKVTVEPRQRRPKVRVGVMFINFLVVFRKNLEFQEFCFVCNITFQKLIGCLKIIYLYASLQNIQTTVFCDLFANMCNSEEKGVARLDT